MLKIARTMTFAQLIPPQDVDEEEIDRLVEKARAEHHAKITRRKAKARKRAALRRRKKSRGDVRG